MDKKVIMSLLLDFYGQLLSEKQLEVMNCYYNDDYSLREISEIVGITRQGVHDTIKRSEQSLLDLEKKLGLYSKWQDVHKKLEVIEKNVVDIQNNVHSDCNKDYIKKQCENTIKTIKEIYKNF